MHQKSTWCIQIYLEVVIIIEEQKDRLFPQFRKELYDYLKSTLSVIMTTGDLDIIVTLICYIFGDLWMRAKTLPFQIEVDKVSEENLRALSSLIGYRWNDGLTPNQQRESIKLFCLIRRWRGTNFGLANLIRVFGQDVTSFYSSSDLRGVEIVEYGSGNADTFEPNMYPGDIKIRIPELSTILRDSIFDTKLAGTRLIFSYYIFMGIYQLLMYEDWGYLIHIWVDYITQGYDTTLKYYGYKFLDTPLSSLLDHQLSHGVRRGEMIASVQLLSYYKAPWQNGFVLNVPGLTNYRGFIEKTPEVFAEHIIYG